MVVAFAWPGGKVLDRLVGDGPVDEAEHLVSANRAEHLDVDHMRGGQFLGGPKPCADLVAEAGADQDFVEG